MIWFEPLSIAYILRAQESYLILGQGCLINNFTIFDLFLTKLTKLLSSTLNSAPFWQNSEMITKWCLSNKYVKQQYTNKDADRVYVFLLYNKIKTLSFFPHSITIIYIFIYYISCIAVGPDGPPYLVIQILRKLNPFLLAWCDPLHTPLTLCIPLHKHITGVVPIYFLHETLQIR